MTITLENNIRKRIKNKPENVLVMLEVHVELSFLIPRMLLVFV